MRLSLVLHVKWLLLAQSSFNSFVVVKLGHFCFLSLEELIMLWLLILLILLNFDQEKVSFTLFVDPTVLIRLNLEFLIEFSGVWMWLGSCDLLNFTIKLSIYVWHEKLRSHFRTQNGNKEITLRRGWINKAHLMMINSNLVKVGLIMCIRSPEKVILHV